MAKKNKKKAEKQRNPIAVAHSRWAPKAGRHTDRKKQANKKACRGKIGE